MRARVKIMEVDRPMPIDSPIDDAAPEAFGQASAGKYIVTVFVIFSMICSGVSLAMWRRSHSVGDVFFRDTAEGRVMVRSIYGRLIISKTHLEEPRMLGLVNDWNYMRIDVPENIRDGWQPGFWKTVGIQQGIDLNPDRGIAQERWLRIRWPTITVITALFPVSSVLRRSRRERAERMEEERLTTSD